MKIVDRQIGYKTEDDEDEDDDDDAVYISLPSSVSNDFLLVKIKVIESISKRPRTLRWCLFQRSIEHVISCCVNADELQRIS